MAGLAAESTVDVKRDSTNAIILEVADDGNGLPADFDAAAAKTLGLRIVRVLAQQLSGRFEMQGGSGTICRVVIPEWKRPQDRLEVTE